MHIYTIKVTIGNESVHIGVKIHGLKEIIVKISLAKVPIIVYTYHHDTSR